MTPIPVVLDGNKHSLTIPIEAIALTVGRGDKYALQLTDGSNLYFAQRQAGQVTFDRIALSIPTVVGRRRQGEHRDRQLRRQAEVLVRHPPAQRPRGQGPGLRRQAPRQDPEGHRVRRLTLARLPQGRYRVKIVTTTARGAHATSVRYYRGCYKTKPQHRGDAPQAAPEVAVQSVGVQLTDQVKQDLTTAMKAGEKERVEALRLVLSELQKAAKDGDGDELAVMRRERKRRQESATAFRDGGREDLATHAEAELAIIETYLPQQLARRGAARDRPRRRRRDRRELPARHGRRDEGARWRRPAAAPTASACRRCPGRS